MIKKIHVDTLKPGHYIDKVEAKWLETPFFNNPVEKEDIIKLKKYKINYIYINVEKSKVKKTNKIIETKKEIKKDNQLKIHERSFEAFKKELNYAKELKAEAFSVASETLKDVRMGKNIKSAKIKSVVEGMVESMDRTPDALLSLARLKDFDNYTFMHSVNVAVLSMTLGKALSFSEKKVFDLGMGGFLHDVGKMKVPEHILNHPGKLTGADWQIMKDHVVYSKEILDEMEEISDNAKALAAQHHERIDGSGYPKKLKLFKIHEFGRIGCIADVYDAVTSRRVYKNEVFPAESMKILIGGKGKAFQPNLVDLFIKEIGLYPIGSTVKLNTGEIAIVVFNNKDYPTTPVIQLLLTATLKKIPNPVELDLTNSDSMREITSIIDPKSYGLEINKYIKS